MLMFKDSTRYKLLPTWSAQYNDHTIEIHKFVVTVLYYFSIHKDKEQVYNSLEHNIFFNELEETTEYIDREISFSLHQFLHIRKPIMSYIDIDNGFKYKYVRNGYAAGLEAKFKTDLRCKDWLRMLNKGLTDEARATFELYGHF